MNLAQLRLPIDGELIVDLFAGGGGASLGLKRAYREPDVAVNHDPVAMAVHRANHPKCEHYTRDVFEVDPLVATRGRPVGVLWASPDCRHHSKAAGRKPRSKRVRGLAWVVVKWATITRPRVIHLENVEEFADWGPLLADGSPCKIRKGITFKRWKRSLEAQGYKVEHRELIAADYGAPTIRKRLYVIARCDGRPITWPKPSHSKTGAGGLPKWRAAAECIDFTRPTRSIFDRPRALAPNTLRRIAKGLWRYVLNTPEPYIVKCNHIYDQFRGQSINEPLQTITQQHGYAVVAPVVVKNNFGEKPAHGVDTPLHTITTQGNRFSLVAPILTEHANASSQRVFDVSEPLRTQCAQVKGGHFAMAAAHLQRQFGQSVGSDASEPVGAITAGGGGKTSLCAAHITKFRQQSPGSAIDAPLHTVTTGGRTDRPAGGGHHGLVSAELAWMEQANSGQEGKSIDYPLSTIMTTGCHQQLASAYLVKFFSNGGQWQDCREPMHTLTTKARMGLVEVVAVPQIDDPELRRKAKLVADFLHEYLPEHFPEPVDMILIGDMLIADITLRMLAAVELALAQGFPTDYILERGLFVDAKAPEGEWRPITKTDQVRLIGNSVCPDVAQAIAAANVPQQLRAEVMEVAA